MRRSSTRSSEVSRNAVHGDGTCEGAVFVCAHGESFPRPRRGVTFFARAKKVTKETRRQGASRCYASVPCAPRPVEGRCGNSLRSDTRTSSPSPDLRCSARSRRTQGQMPQLHPVNPRHVWMLLFLILILIFQSALSEPSIARESGAKRRRCLSAASSAPSPDSPRSTGNRRAATARAPAAYFFGYFLCTSKESDTSPQARKRSAGHDPASAMHRANKNARRGARRSCTTVERWLTPPSTPAARRCALPAAGGS